MPPSDEADKVMRPSWNRDSVIHLSQRANAHISNRVYISYDGIGIYVEVLESSALLNS